MENRGFFLESRYNSNSNNFNLEIPIQPNHIGIFNKLSNYFKPASPLTDDIKNLVTGNLNLCKDKNIIIFFKSDNKKLNTLKFYLLMNFISNWKPYNEYVSSLVNNDYTNYGSLSYDTFTLEDVSELRFREDGKEGITKIYNVDILYLIVQPTTRLFEDSFYKDIFRVTLSLRANKGLITIIIFNGTENQFKLSNFEEKTLGVSLKSYNLIEGTVSKNSTTSKKSKIKMDEGDEF